MKKEEKKDAMKNFYKNLLAENKRIANGVNNVKMTLENSGIHTVLRCYEIDVFEKDMRLTIAPVYHSLISGIEEWTVRDVINPPVIKQDVPHVSVLDEVLEKLEYELKTEDLVENVCKLVAMKMIYS
ncbi:MAG: hypothetical protein KatS3mg104_2974 [Phycisphaerae bacterium]|nr:MAG: hypothetical protein KatS3mg104_2974 [Phycisphaerae bacterium]